MHSHTPSPPSRPCLLAGDVDESLVLWGGIISLLHNVGVKSCLLPAGEDNKSHSFQLELILLNSLIPSSVRKPIMTIQLNMLFCGLRVLSVQKNGTKTHELLKPNHSSEMVFRFTQ